MTPFEVAWLGAFAWTCAVELPVYVWLCRGMWRSALGPVVFTLALHSVTHRALWFLGPNAADGVWPVVAAEAAIVVVEAGALLLVGTVRGGPVSIARAFSATAIANTASVVAGVFLTCAGWWAG